jgi:hypothetical protein
MRVRNMNRTTRLLHPVNRISLPAKMLLSKSPFSTKIQLSNNLLKRETKDQQSSQPAVHSDLKSQVLKSKPATNLSLTRKIFTSTWKSIVDTLLPLTLIKPNVRFGVAYLIGNRHCIKILEQFDKDLGKAAEIILGLIHHAADCEKDSLVFPDGKYSREGSVSDINIWENKLKELIEQKKISEYFVALDPKLTPAERMKIEISIKNINTMIKMINYRRHFVDIEETKWKWDPEVRMFYRGRSLSEIARDRGTEPSQGVIDDKEKDMVTYMPISEMTTVEVTDDSTNKIKKSL